MKRELFQKYLWLIDLIRHNNEISYDEIARKWEDSAVNFDHSPLALRTFHNHREAVETLFGIRILCNRSNHTYYIPDEKDENGSTRLKIWMLQTLCMNNAITSGKSLTDRVIIDTANDQQLNLSIIMEGMRDEVAINIEYLSRLGEKEALRVGPYAVRYWHNKWYLLAEDLSADSKELRIFDVDRITSVAPTEDYFEFPFNFSCEDYFRHFFGLPLPESEGKATQVVVKLSGHAKVAADFNPIHPTQCEIYSDSDYSLYSLKIVPSEEFVESILSLGDEAEVISPPSIRKSIRNQVRNLADAYNNRPDPAIVYKAHVNRKKATAKA